ncbi:MAG: SPFH domain-containing protein [Kineosporiaceae bacterium]
MAHITAPVLLGGRLRHYRGTPTVYVVHRQGGEVRHRGVAASFWFRPLSAALSEAPTDDRELPALVHARTSDLADVSVQLTLTYRFADPDLAATRLDFGVDPRRGEAGGEPLQQVAQVLTELAQQYATEVVGTLPVAAAVAQGPAAVRDNLTARLHADPRLAEIGLQVIGVRVLALRPDADLERALATPTREAVQADADRATFERRALAVERERAIAENELQSRIELAVREEQLVVQQGANARRKAAEDAAAQQIAADAEAAAKRTRAAADAEVTRVVGQARADAEAAAMAVHQGVPPQVLLALAARELAGNLPEIGTLQLTPDVLGQALAHVAGRA